MPEVSRIKGGRLLLASGLVVVLVLTLGRLAASAYVEILWFRSMGYSSTMWTRFFWGWGVRAGAMALVALVVLANLHFVARTLGRIQIKRRFGNLEIAEQLPPKTIFMGAVGVALLLGLWFGASIPRSLGLQLLFLLQRPEWGLVDPVMGKDIGYYVFTLPVLGAATTFALVLVFLVLSTCTAGYTATGALQWERGRVSVGPGPRLHLSILVAAFFVLMAARLWLGRSILLLDGSSDIQGIFGFTDANARMPALRIMMVLSLFAAAGAIWTGRSGRALPLLSGVGGVVLGGLLAGQAYPAFVQRFRVEPNELQRESPYIEHNLELARLAFGLDKLERRTLTFNEAGQGIDFDAAKSQLEGLPVWSQSALLTTYREVEARFPYYDFRTVAIDRYPSENGLVPVALSVREISPFGIQDPNWQNVHLRSRYISGMGAVASHAAEKTVEGRPSMFLESIPPEFSARDGVPAALDLQQSTVFIGGAPQPYAVVTEDDGAGSEEADRIGDQVGVDFPEGIRLGSVIRKLALAWRFRDANLLFASEISSDSRFLFRRGLYERASAVSGDLIRFPEAAYPVITEGRIVWMLEGFTATRWFPLSTMQRLGRGTVRYARNSVKATVDAVTGEVRFYVADPNDPLLAAYAKAFPGLFLPLDDMPSELREHARYSKEMLRLQARVLSQYHQETAAEFHGQQDVWEFPQELADGLTPVPYLPEYGILRLPGESEAEFVLSTTFVPRGRQNLTAMLFGRSDPSRLGELVLLDIPVESQVPGPRQIEALVEQDPTISEQLSLWRSGGSQVWTGHLHVVPVGDGLLYMEPVFLAAEEDAIPELRRFVVSDGRRVIMRPGLLEALSELIGGAPFTPAAVSDVVSGATEPGLGSTLDPSEWPNEALELLDSAEQRLRAGDYQGFGEAIDQLRALLRDLSEGGG